MITQYIINWIGKYQIPTQGWEILKNAWTSVDIAYFAFRKIWYKPASWCRKLCKLLLKLYLRYFKQINVLRKHKQIYLSNRSKFTDDYSSCKANPWLASVPVQIIKRVQSESQNSYHMSKNILQSWLRCTCPVAPTIVKDTKMPRKHYYYQPFQQLQWFLAPTGALIVIVC